MEKHFVIVLLFIASLFGGNAFGQDVVFVGGFGSPAYEVREFGEAVGANITIPLPGNALQVLFTGYPADKVYAQVKNLVHPVIIAHSWGGRVICRMLADHPEFAPAKVIFVGSPLGELPGAPPEWLFGEVVYRADIPFYVMASKGDETVPISRAAVVPDARETVVLENVGHTKYFSDANASAKIRSWVYDPGLLLLSAR